MLKGVVAVISGITNPERGHLREKLIQMGADYRDEWSDGCTHVVTAYARTPKVAQALRSGGVAVMKDWVLQSFRKQTRLNEAEFAPQDDKQHAQHLQHSQASQDAQIKGYKSDSDDDDDGLPNEYDVNDKFIDNRFERVCCAVCTHEQTCALKVDASR